MTSDEIPVELPDDKKPTTKEALRARKLAIRNGTLIAPPRDEVEKAKQAEARAKAEADAEAAQEARREREAGAAADKKTAADKFTEEQIAKGPGAGGVMDPTTRTDIAGEPMRSAGELAQEAAPVEQAAEQVGEATGEARVEVSGDTIEG